MNKNKFLSYFCFSIFIFLKANAQIPLVHDTKTQNSSKNILFSASLNTTSLINTTQISNFSIFGSPPASDIVEFNNQLCFFAADIYDAIHDDYIYNLWCTNGASLTKLTNFTIYNQSINTSIPLKIVSNKLVFVVLPDKIWLSSGTPLTTQLFHTATGTGYTNANILHSYVENNLYLFSVQNNLGHALWRSDLTLLGTYPISAILSGRIIALSYLQYAGEHIIFNVFGTMNSPAQTFLSDGANAITDTVVDGDNNQIIFAYDYFNWQNNIGFLGRTAQDSFSNLWLFDGTTATKISNFPEIFGNDMNFNYQDGDTIYLSRDNLDDNRTELWKVDLSNSISAKIGSIPYYYLSIEENSYKIGSKLYMFLTNFENYHSELWSFDLNTNTSSNIFSSEYGDYEEFYPFFDRIDNILYFLAKDPTDDKLKLWASDGNWYNTHPIIDSFSSNNIFDNKISKMIKYQGEIYFFADLYNKGSELYKISPPILIPDFCPLDPQKNTLGICGCGISDSDLSGNGVADCKDPTPNTVPSQVKLKIKKRDVDFTFQAFNSVSYKLFLKKLPNPPLVKKSKITTKNSSSNILKLKKLKPGKYSAYYTIKYGPNSETKKSKPKSFKIK